MVIVVFIMITVLQKKKLLKNMLSKRAFLGKHVNKKGTLLSELRYAH